MRVYYAHCQSIYNTQQEARDIHLLTRLGFNVENPNAGQHNLQAERIRAQWSSKADASEKVMDYFVQVVSYCDALAFAPLPDGKIPAGVYREVWAAKDMGMPVFEIPRSISSRGMNVASTREYLREVGQR